MMKPVRLFLSYSRESPRQERRVRRLADRLRGDGFEVRLDQYEERFTEALTRWMQREIADADYVLVIATETYERRASGQEEETGRGQGIAFESHLIFQELFAASMRNAKYIPVVFTAADERFIPGPLRGYRFYRVDTGAGYDALCRNLRERSPVVAADASPAAASSFGPRLPLVWAALAAALLLASGYLAFRLLPPPTAPPQEARPAAPADAGPETADLPAKTAPQPSPTAAALKPEEPALRETLPLPPPPSAPAQPSGPIQVSGTGFAPDDSPASQRAALARRAAEIDARRRLAEQIATRIRSQTRVVSGKVMEDEILATVDQLIKGARVVQERELPDGGYEVLLEATLSRP